MERKKKMEKRNGKALLPIFVFVVLYLGLGILFEYGLRIEMGFYKIPVVVIFLIALLVACLQNRALQLNDKLATPAEVMDYVLAEKRRMSAEDQRQMTVSIRADRQVPMGVVMDVKQALRQAKVLRVNYSAVEKSK